MTTPPPTSTYYSKAFCVKCLTDRNRTGGVWRNRMFFCAACAQLEAQPAAHVQKQPKIEHVAGDVSQNWAESNMSTQPATQQEAQEPVAWYVTGCSRLLDEDDAKAEARHIGGTARAMPLYTAPQPSPTPQADSQPALPEIKAYEDLGGAADDVQLLRMGYAAARLEIESLQARIKTMRAPADSVTAPAGGADWQDISTAPKDGTRFVAVGQNYGLDSEAQHTCIAQWLAGCWVEVSDWNGASKLKYLTHWMPLPPLPCSAARAPADSVLEDAALLKEARDALWQPANVALCERIDAYLDAARKQGGK